MEDGKRKRPSYSMIVLQDIKPETIIPWALPLAFLMHLLDESFLNGGFVNGVQRLLWPQYNWTKFGLVNAGFFLLICLSSYLYHLRPGKWLILPIFWLWERSWNGIWHVLWTLIWQEYSPGLATSLLFPVMLIGFFSRLQSKETVSIKAQFGAAASSLIFEMLLISSLFISR